MNYYRLLSIPLILLFIIFTGSIKSTNAQNLDWGLSAGMSVSSHMEDFLYNEDDISLQFSPNAAVGYNVGAIARTNISRVLRVQVEPSLILLGATYDDTFELRGTEFETDSRTELIYAQLPLVMQLTTAPSQKTVYGRKNASTTFHVTGGIFGGYLLDARFTGSNSGAPLGIAFEGDFSNDVKPQYKEYDAGAIFGVGFERGHYSKFGFETRAQFSVINSGNNIDSPSFKPQNYAFTASLYYLF